MKTQLIPFGDRILVQRKTVGEKAGSIYLPDTVKERPTDIAEVLYTPEHTFADKELLLHADRIITALTKKSQEGDPDALVALLRLNEFIKIKSIQPGDKIFISKYVGTDFYDTNNPEQSLTIVRGDDVIALVVDK